MAKMPDITVDLKAMYVHTEIRLQFRNPATPDLILGRTIPAYSIPRLHEQVRIPAGDELERPIAGTVASIGWDLSAGGPVVIGLVDVHDVR